MGVVSVKISLRNGGSIWWALFLCSGHSVSILFASWLAQSLKEVLIKMEDSSYKLRNCSIEYV